MSSHVVTTAHGSTNDAGCACSRKYATHAVLNDIARAAEPLPIAELQGASGRRSKNDSVVTSGSFTQVVVVALFWQ